MRQGLVWSEPAMTKTFEVSASQMFDKRAADKRAKLGFIKRKGEYTLVTVE